MQPGAVSSEGYQEAEGFGAILEVDVISVTHKNDRPGWPSLTVGLLTLANKLRVRFIKSRSNEIASMPETRLD
jgi:hypothetical protein